MDATFKFEDTTIKALISIEAKINALSNLTMSVLSKVDGNTDLRKLADTFNDMAQEEQKKLVEFYRTQQKQ